MTSKPTSSPPTKDTIVEGLKLFNEKTDILNRRNFTKIVESVKRSFTISGKDLATSNPTYSGERVGPDEEAIHSFVTTFRFFIQDNEKCSLRNLASYYNSGLIEASLKDKFNNCRNSLNKFLDGSPLPFNATVEIGNGPEPLTGALLLDIFMYGGIAHANPKKKGAFDFFMSNPTTQVMTEEGFVRILEVMLSGFNYIKSLNEEALKQLS